ncbi:MAG: PGPGW domain-containing protein [Pseudomonadota bacterium]
MTASLRKLGVFAAGSVLLVIGAAMLVLPGPGVVVIAGALALLSTEFAFARGPLERVRRYLSSFSAWRRRKASQRRLSK